MFLNPFTCNEIKVNTYEISDEAEDCTKREVQFYNDGSVSCSCGHATRLELLCRHVFTVWSKKETLSLRVASL